MARDHYQILSVERDASESEIRKAFRLRAKQIHPDHNPDDPDANAKFITLKKAHDLLVDPVARGNYDRDLLRSDNRRGKNSRHGAGESHQPGAQRNKNAGSRGAPKPRRGHDIERTIRITLEQAWNGSSHTVVRDSGHHTFHIRGIPADNRFCIRGKGGIGESGGPDGDLYVVVEAMSHKHFTREGDDLTYNLSLDTEFAQHGGEKKVDTLSGKVRMTIKAGAKTGHTYRLAGKGLPRFRTDDQFGDLYVRIEVRKPEPIRGLNLERQIRINLREAWAGGERQITVTGNINTFTVPPGAHDGQRLYIPGKGRPGKHGGLPGDLYINITVLPDEVFRRDDDDLYLNEGVEIDLNTALKGGIVEVNTLSGNTVLEVPPGTRFGQILSLAGHGMPTTDRSESFGNLYAHVHIQVPEADEWEVDGRYYSWYWPASRQPDDNSLYLKIQFREGGYVWAVLVNNSRLQYRGRDPRYCGKCIPTNDSKQAKLNAAAKARNEAAIALLRRSREEQFSVDVGEIPF